MGAEADGQEVEVVLVVDDDNAFLESLIGVLTSAGIRSVGASSVREALLFQATHLPGVIVVDEQLPDGSGTEFAHTIKEHNPDTVVIVLSAYPTIDTATDAVGTFFAYLVKPVASQVFLQTVEHALSRHREEVRRVHQPKQVIAVADAASKRIDVGIAQARLLNRLVAIVVLLVALALIGVQTYRNSQFSNDIARISTNQAENRAIFEQTQRDAAKTYTLVCDIAKTYHVAVCPAVP